jgi:hypothetical protein
MTSSSGDTSASPRPGAAQSLSRGVADDLDAILAPAGEPASRKLRLRGASAAPVRRRSDGRAARLGALAAAACIGVSAGAMIPKWSHEARPSAAAPAAPTPRTLAIVQARTPEPAPLQTAGLVPIASLAPDPEPAPKRAAPSRSAERRREAKVDRAPACASARHCGYSDVMAADARLRRAYGHAVRAGVARSVLVDYRNEWSSLRRGASHNPGRTAKGYRRLASELDEIATTHRVVYRPPREEHGLGRIGQELASLLP